MELGATRRLTLSIGLLVAVQLVTSLGAIILLERMGPAIEKIWVQSVTGVRSVEDMALALAESPADAAARSRFLQALDRAKVDLQDPESRPALVELETVADDALKTDGEARRRAAAALRLLGATNRDAIGRADARARRLGTAGAWAAAFLGLGGLLASGITMRRLERRVLGPIGDIARVVAAHRAGEEHRRCTSAFAQGELGLVVLTLNELFDFRERSGHLLASSRSDADDRELLLHLLDERDRPVIVAGHRGDVVVANKKALAMLSSSNGKALRAAIADAVVGGNPEIEIDVERVGATDQWLCSLPRSDRDDPRPAVGS